MIDSLPRYCGILLLIVSCTPATLRAAPGGDQDELIQLITQLLANSDRDMRALGLEQIRTQAPGQEATERFAALLSTVRPEIQVELIGALADRGDRTARKGIIPLLVSSQAESVRVAAIEALGQLGSPEDLPLLLQRLAVGTAAEQAAARNSLTRLQGESTSPAIAAQLSRAEPALRIQLMEILVARRAFDTADAFVPQAAAGDASVRAAAMTALSRLAQPPQIPGLVQGVLAAQPGRERETAEKSLMLACHRDDDSEPMTQALLAAFAALPSPNQTALLSALGRVGGPAVLPRIQQAIRSSDPRRHEAGLRAICNWPDASVAPVLMQLARTDRHPGDRRAALRALIRVAPLPDGRTDQEKLQLLQQTWPLCERDEDRNLVLQRAGAIRLLETLHFLLPFLDQPPYAQQACQSIVELAHHRSLREPNKEAFDKALDRVKQITSDPVVKDRAGRYQRGETWVRGQ